MEKAKKVSGGKLSHYDSAGRARVGHYQRKRPHDAKRKPGLRRCLRRSCGRCRTIPKGTRWKWPDLLEFRAKPTSELIPMCHPLPLSFVDVTTEVCENGVKISPKAATTAQTGVEMEALMAATVAALTVYDMCKALDKSITIREIALLSKSGGKSGEFRRQGASILCGKTA